ncbi:MAG: type II secretion system ATPase GspE [Deltaproteobacteria bacterium]|nr:type II secretion system ATPase GspE [Deltaproteobacteria bacterium]
MKEREDFKVEAQGRALSRPTLFEAVSMKTILLGEMLVNEGLLDGVMIAPAVAEQAKTRERIGSTLVRLGYLSENEILKPLSEQFGIPALQSHEYPQGPPDIESAPTVKFLRQYKVVPVGIDNGTLRVATAYPQDPFPLEAIRVSTGLEVEPVLGTENDILNAIESYYGGGLVTMEKIIEGMDEKDGDRSAFDVDDVEHLKDMALEAPIINLVNIIITGAVERRASDIHIEPFEEMVHVRYRVDGILYLKESLPKRLHLAVASRIKIMSKLNIAERRLPQDGRIRLNAAGKDIDIRVSTIPTHYGESIVMRLLDSSGVLSLESIGFSPENRKAFEALIRQPHGMILVTGPTGSGKSTTLYAVLSRIDTVEKKVITIEDPVEYNLEGVNQIQVKPKIGLTFGNGLRSIVRQDPDVIMVGEIRDLETADIAIHSALTGHLILSTLHTNDAPGAVTRLVDMGVEGYLISSSVLGVLAQRLVRVVCEHCKVSYAPGPEEIRLISAEFGRSSKMDAGEFSLYRGEGCERCDNSGYRGRTGIFELMTMNDDLRQMVVEKKGSNMMRLKAMERGMITLREDGWDKVLKGITTIDEVTRVTLDQ